MTARQLAAALRDMAAAFPPEVLAAERRLADEALAEAQRLTGPPAADSWALDGPKRARGGVKVRLRPGPRRKRGAKGGSGQPVDATLAGRVNTYVKARHRARLAAAWGRTVRG